MLRFFHRISKISTPAFQQRFIRVYEEYASAVVTEAEQQLSGFVIPNVDRYMRLRRATAGALPSLAMAEMDLDLPDEVRYHPVIVELEDIMRDVICVVNVSD